jgi:hypothetical protein
MALGSTQPLKNEYKNYRGGGGVGVKGSLNACTADSLDDSQPCGPSQSVARKALQFFYRPLY